MAEKPKPSMPSWLGNQAIICPKCGARNNLGSRMCYKCGNQLIHNWKEGF